MATIIETERLRLRTWDDGDGAAFGAATNTPTVMRWLGGIADPATFEAIEARVQAEQAAHGHCFWIVERKDDGRMLGFCGLKIASDAGAPIEGEVEVGWRLREDAWGQGYAKETARACLDWAWLNTAAPRVVAITVPGNRASWGLMERLGMTRRPDLDFAHPQFPPEHELSRHITYVTERPA